MSATPARPRRRPKGFALVVGRVLAVAALLAIVALPSGGFGGIGGIGAVAPFAAPAVKAAQDTPQLDEPSVPVRIRIPSIGVVLPVVSSDLRVRGNRRGYPLCDVAQYWTIYDLPGAPGTAWIYAHAQPRMFLPILENTLATSGRGLVGDLVTVQLRDGRVLRYRIEEVRQHALNRRIARRDRPGEQRLVLQTSEGPPGTAPKLQVAARLAGATTTDERAPRARPRVCSQPRSTTNGGRRPSATAAPAAGVDGASGGSSPDTMVSLAIGGGAVLLGATLVAIYLVRRPPSTARRRT
jgi:hypothetical protein